MQTTTPQTTTPQLSPGQAFAAAAASLARAAALLEADAKTLQAVGQFLCPDDRVKAARRAQIDRRRRMEALTLR